ncbi:hypothetical protein [Deinococcus yavapaiensis]|uniref:Uncharacterized protein n=1 Tax=Deinococcus yavapaiensis KR-236 TaxID=694435 RepID=A0A318S4I8_9DEIO|nr:hypothetical protein [Deinococcus yavapaiensis]PYE52980.1 hypothetical protein DES52_111153 [Deinococcus yavapaiensis KR-236]
MTRASLDAWRAGTRAALREARDGPPGARLSWLRVPQGVPDVDVRALTRGDLAERTVTLRLDAPPTPLGVLSALLVHFGLGVPRGANATFAAVAAALEAHDTRVVLFDGGDDLQAARTAGSDFELVVTAFKVIACAGVGRAVVVCGRAAPIDGFDVLEPVSPRDLGARAVPRFDTPGQAEAHLRRALENVDYVLSVARTAVTVRARLATALDEDGEAGARDALVDAYATLVEGGVPRDMRASLLALRDADAREAN